MAYLLAERIIRVASRLRVGWGIDVVEIPGWQSRGAGEHRAMLALVRHHTASPAHAGDSASLRIVTHGRADLRNSLSMWHQPRLGRRIHLVAAGVSWHAGRGGWMHTGNSISAGVEVENDGRGEPFTDDQMYVTRALEVEMAREFGWPQMLTGCEHAEHTPRKVDRFGIDGEAERRLVADVLTTSDRSLAVETTNREMDMIRLGQRDPTDQNPGPVTELQHWVNRLLYATGGNFEGGGRAHDRAGSHLTPDGHFGPATLAGVTEAFSRAERVLEHPTYADPRAVTAMAQAALVTATERALQPSSSDGALDGPWMIDAGRLVLRRPAN